MDENAGIIIAFLGLVVIVFGQAATALITFRMAAKEREETRYKDRQKFIADTINRLIALRSEIVYWWHVGDHEGNRKLKKVYAEAYGVMISVRDADIRKIAKDGKEMGRTEEGLVSEMLISIDFAIKRLGDMD